MSSYGRQKVFAAIILTIATILALRIFADILMPAPPAKQDIPAPAPSPVTPDNSDNNDNIQL